MPLSSFVKTGVQSPTLRAARTDKQTMSPLLHDVDEAIDAGLVVRDKSGTNISLYIEDLISPPQDDQHRFVDAAHFHWFPAFDASNRMAVIVASSRWFSVSMRELALTPMSTSLPRTPMVFSSELSNPVASMLRNDVARASAPIPRPNEICASLISKMEFKISCGYRFVFLTGGASGSNSEYDDDEAIVLLLW